MSIIRLITWSLSAKLLHCPHNERNGVSNQRRLDCLHSRLFGCRSKKASKLRVIGLCEGNSPVTGEFPTQRGSNAEFVFSSDDAIMSSKEIPLLTREGEIWSVLCDIYIVWAISSFHVSSRIVANISELSFLLSQCLFIPYWRKILLENYYPTFRRTLQNVAFRGCFSIIVFYRYLFSGADNYKNRSNYDTSNRFGTDTLWGSLVKKKTRATQNFNMAAIFQDGRRLAAMEYLELGVLS